MQDIPLHNSTDRQMTYTAIFSGSTAQNFWVTREVVVGPRSHSSFQLTFAPRWVRTPAPSHTTRASAQNQCASVCALSLALSSTASPLPPFSSSL